MKINLINIFCLSVFTVLIFQSHSFAQSKHDEFSSIGCAKNPALQKLRSNELAEMGKADQAERSTINSMTLDMMIQMTKNDLKRRQRVAEIFAEGCFKSAEDYRIAALIFQHGDVPDHFYQAYLWAKKSAELGNKNGNNFAALAIDRYLINIGKKQLFGSQFLIAGYNTMDPAKCYCMQPIETSFPDSKRIKFLGHSLQENYHALASMNKGKNCQKVNPVCKTPLKPTLKGSFPGIW